MKFTLACLAAAGSLFALFHTNPAPVRTIIDGSRPASAEARTTESIGLIGRRDGSGSGNVITTVNLGSGEARHAEVTIEQVTGDGVIASGGFYDWAPGETIPQGDITMPSGMKMSAIQSRWETLHNPVFIRGLTGAYDGSQWIGMIERDGTFSYSTVLGAAKTIPAYKVSSAQDPLLAYREAYQSTWHPGGTALDQKAKRH